MKKVAIAMLFVLAFASVAEARCCGRGFFGRRIVYRLTHPFGPVLRNSNAYSRGNCAPQGNCNNGSCSPQGGACRTCRQIGWWTRYGACVSGTKGLCVKTTHPLGSFLVFYMIPLRWYGMVIGLVNGFFNPIHLGHLMLLYAAKQRCNYLAVVVNNEHCVREKGAIPFYDEQTRLKIVESLKPVNIAVLSYDDPRENVLEIRPDIIFQGVDKTEDTLPEDLRKFYDEIKVKVEYIGGDSKVNSSSKLIEDAAVEWLVRRRMGWKS